MWSFFFSVGRKILHRLSGRGALVICGTSRSMDYTPSVLSRVFLCVVMAAGIAG